MKVGDVFTSNNCGEFSILSIKNANNVIIEFSDTGFICNTAKCCIITGRIKDPFCRSIRGVGYLGQGIHAAYVNGKISRSYSVWKGMMDRCYGEKTISYSQYGARGVVVCDEWHNFQNFAGWYTENHVVGFHMDKDLRFRGNKIYGPLTCEFIPPKVNMTLPSARKIRGKYPVGVTLNKSNDSFSAQCCLGDGRHVHLGVYCTPEEAFRAYKLCKELHIQSVALEYYKAGEISRQIYDTLMAWDIDIND